GPLIVEKPMGMVVGIKIIANDPTGIVDALRKCLYGPSRDAARCEIDSGEIAFIVHKAVGLVVGIQIVSDNATVFPNPFGEGALDSRGGVECRKNPFVVKKSVGQARRVKIIANDLPRGVYAGRYGIAELGAIGTERVVDRRKYI